VANTGQKSPSDEVADEVQQWRRRRNWTYAQLAQKAGMSESVLLNLLTRRDRVAHGRTIPARPFTIEEMMALAAAFDTSVIHFLPRSVIANAFELRFESPEAASHFDQHYYQIAKLIELKSNQEARKS
jgi:transcriptional regulator with XRE-family HTH domain